MLKKYNFYHLRKFFEKNIFRSRNIDEYLIISCTGMIYVFNKIHKISYVFLLYAALNIYHTAGQVFEARFLQSIPSTIIFVNIKSASLFQCLG